MDRVQSLKALSLAVHLKNMAKDAKEFMSEVIAKLNKAGFSGGFYKYQENECSCCFGLKDTFFQVNENVPVNWGIYDTDKFYYKISYYSRDDSEMKRFRTVANKLVRKYFGKMADTAKGNHEAVIVYVR